jgi:BMFP domain-containing protein YqiC
MVSGEDNVSGNRRSSWPFYLCGRKKREGWHACPSGKIGARGPEEALLQLVTRRVLNADFGSSLVTEVNARMVQDAPSVQGQIDDTEQQLAEIEQAISNLLDLAERFGATSAGPRIAEREAERAQLQARVRRLELQQEASELAIPPETIHSTLTTMRKDLAEGDLPAKRDVLSKVVAKIVMGPASAEMSYTFPLHEMTGMYTTPPWGHFQYPRQKQQSLPGEPACGPACLFPSSHSAHRTATRPKKDRDALCSDHNAGRIEHRARSVGEPEVPSSTPRAAWPIRQTMDDKKEASPDMELASVA